MARLRMLGHVGGSYDGNKWPPRGGIVEVGKQSLVDELVRGGLAEILPDLAPEPVIETAEKAPPENTAKRTYKPKPKPKPRTRKGPQ